VGIECQALGKLLFYAYLQGIEVGVHVVRALLYTTTPAAGSRGKSRYISPTIIRPAAGKPFPAAIKLQQRCAVVSIVVVHTVRTKHPTPSPFRIVGRVVECLSVNAELRRQENGGLIRVVRVADTSTQRMRPLVAHVSHRYRECRGNGPLEAQVPCIDGRQ